MRTALGRVLHFGASGGTQHFWRSRVTAAANVILVIGFILVMLSAVGRPHDEVVAIIGSPFVATLFVLLIANAAVHMRLGIQTSIEDYIHNEPLKILLLVGATFFAFGVAALAIMSVLSMAFGG